MTVIERALYQRPKLSLPDFALKYSGKRHAEVGVVRPAPVRTDRYHRDITASSVLDMNRNTPEVCILSTSPNFAEEVQDGKQASSER